ncbi:hypothetical protein FHS51_002489 [Sphingobium wenxiniae]|nr:hypothetical protein [Sphingobium wenxiniae]
MAAKAPTKAAIPAHRDKSWIDCSALSAKAGAAKAFPIGR